MKVNRFAVALGVVAVAAFMAGRADFTSGNSAAAQDGHDHPHHQHQGEASTQMEEWMQRMHEAGEPGKHHELLKKMTGTWEGTYSWSMGPNIPPMEMEGTMKRELIFGGRYLKETVESSFEGQPFTGIGFLGYNNATGEFEMAWMDSHSTGIYTESGTYDPTTQTLMLWSRQINPMTGKIMHTQGKVDMSNSNRHTTVGYATGPNGEWYKMFEGVFEKVN